MKPSQVLHEFAERKGVGKHLLPHFGRFENVAVEITMRDNCRTWHIVVDRAAVWELDRRGVVLLRSRETKKPFRE